MAAGDVEGPFCCLGCDVSLSRGTDRGLIVKVCMFPHLSKATGASPGASVISWFHLVTSQNCRPGTVMQSWRSRPSLDPFGQPSGTSALPPLLREGLTAAKSQRHRHNL
ncbi:hypothetical protein E2C01_031963 [Portunus trituberculatus]|uniref:Uncharacterized protein n=1 Tax=Portunus trituberculatus TaxID=210409 RepID=A0A5B7EZA4_PORTR|nr:hypothetical protein [Portunus trituberculatus]